MLRITFALVFLGLVLFVPGCTTGSSAGGAGAVWSPTKPVPKLVTDPVAAVKAVLPAGWEVLRVQKGAYPHGRRKGNGTAIYLAETGRAYFKAQYSAALFIMPADYQDERTEEGQAAPASHLVTTAEAKIYLWNGQDLRKLLLKALIQE